jgi:hypothetical protein
MYLKRLPEELHAGLDAWRQVERLLSGQAGHRDRISDPHSEKNARH